jgi:hypothetical protein
MLAVKDSNHRRQLGPSVTEPMVVALHRLGSAPFTVRDLVNQVPPSSRDPEDRRAYYVARTVVSRFEEAGTIRNVTPDRGRGAMYKVVGTLPPAPNGNGSTYAPNGTGDLDVLILAELRSLNTKLDQLVRLWS